MRSLLLTALVTFLVCTGTRAQETDVLTVRIVDVGAGLCTIAHAPPNRYMVYDVGHWMGNDCVEAIQEFVEGERIDVLVISHPDSDHLGDAPALLGAYSVHRILRTGYERWDRTTWRATTDSIGQEVRYGASVQNLKTQELEPGKTIPLGDAMLTLLAGWHEWTKPGPTSAERRNAISIVLRLDYAGRSILYTGDTIGRRLDDDLEACKDAEKVMANRHDAGEVSLTSDVLIAPHHGGNNASSKCFVQRIDPAWVIFSAGHSHGHPTVGAAERYLDQGVKLDSIFRTDRGDDEDDPDEWTHLSVDGCKDGKGDDGVEIVIKPEGDVSVDYLMPAAGC